MSFNQKKMGLGLLFLLLGASAVNAGVQAEGHGHSASKTENAHLLDPTHPTGLNLKAVAQQLKDERQGAGVSNSICTKIVNIGTNKDQILKKSEALALSFASHPEKQKEKKNILNRLKNNPLSSGKKDEKSGEVSSQLAIIGGLMMINQKLEADVSKALGLTPDQVRKIPPSSSFVGGTGGVSRAKSESDVTRPGHNKGAYTWQAGHIPTVPTTKTQSENQGQSGGGKSFTSSPQLSRQQH